MAKAAKPCMEPGCPYTKKMGHPKWCVWHWLAHQPPDIQSTAARKRWRRAMEGDLAIERKRVPESEWPPGERWCAGCQTFVPLFYTRGSRCQACASSAAHLQHIRATYGLSPEEYQALYDWQGGRCYICRRQSRSKRLAVDHDHVTGAVRGLLCPDETRGCNHAILGNIKDLAMAQRVVEYLERPPMVRVRAGEPPVGAREEIDEAERRLYPNGRNPRDWLLTIHGFIQRKRAGLVGTDLVLPYGDMPSPRHEATTDPKVVDPFVEPIREAMAAAGEPLTRRQIGHVIDEYVRLIAESEPEPPRQGPPEPAGRPGGYSPAPFIDSPF
jgi:hypothetical protein